MSVIRVAIASTGDEVVGPGAAFSEGLVYAATAPMLAALIASAGARPTDLGVLPDNRDEVKRRLADAAQRFDAVILSGGASRGRRAPRGT